MRNAYVAVIRKAPRGGFAVAFPDFPGCAARARTPEEAVRAARQALSRHVHRLVTKGQPLPEPTPSGTIYAEAAGDGAVLQFIEPELPTRTVRVNITMDERLLADLDRRAAAHGLTRSGYLAELARFDLARGAARLQGRKDWAPADGRNPAVQLFARVRSRSGRQPGPWPTELGTGPRRRPAADGGR